MSLYTGGDGANIKDSLQISLVKIVNALTKGIGGSAGELASYPAIGTANAFAASVVFKSTGGTLYYLKAYNTNGSTRYLMLFDAASLPANGTVPLAIVPLLTKTSGVLDFGDVGLTTKNGLVAALSSTDTSLTVAVAADGLFTAVLI